MTVTINVRWIMTVLWLAGCMGCSAWAAESEGLRKASTVLNSPFVWPNNNTLEMIQRGVISSQQLAMVENGAGLPWESQQSNKQRCAQEQLRVAPNRVEIRVGESIAVADLTMESSAFGRYYFDAAIARRWKFANELLVLERSGMHFRAVKAGITELNLDSLCRARRLPSPVTSVAVTVIVSP